MIGMQRGQHARTKCAGSIAVWLQLILILETTYGRLQHPTDLSHFPEAQPHLLHVFVYDGVFDWTPVYTADPHTSGVVEWMRHLPDRLTQSAADPEGKSLLVQGACCIEECYINVNIACCQHNILMFQSINVGSLNTQCILIPSSLHLQLLLLADLYRTCGVCIQVEVWCRFLTNGVYQRLCNTLVMSMAGQKISAWQLCYKGNLTWISHLS